MANNLKDIPVGLDAVIHKTQIILYDELSLLWGVNLEGYPRCYVINRDGRNTIEHYISDKEYLSLIHAERNKFFFTAENDFEKKRVNNFEFETDIELYFVVNVAEIKPTILHRGDEEIRNDVLNVLQSIPDVLATSVVINVDRVFNGFEHREMYDMQPYHAFKIVLNVPKFVINQKYCS